MTVPNVLTIFRISLIPLLLVVLLVPDLVREKELLASAIMAVAGISDSLDGYIARRRGQITTVGTLLDPVADKLLISAAFIALVDMHVVKTWMAVVIIGREFAVSGLRNMASAEGLTISASPLAKAKMVLQVVAVIAVLLGMRFALLQPIATLALWLVVVFAAVSALEYFHGFWGEIDRRATARDRGAEAEKVVEHRERDVAAH